MSDDFAETHEELRQVARGLLTVGGGRSAEPAALSWSQLADAGWLGLEVPEESGGAGATFAEVCVVLAEMGRAASTSPFLGTVALGVGALNLLDAPAARETLRAVAAGQLKVALVVATGDDTRTLLHLDGADGAWRLDGEAEFVPDAYEADLLLVVADDPEGGPVIVPLQAPRLGLTVSAQPVLDATRRFGVVTAAGVAVDRDDVWRFRGGAGGADSAVRALLDRGAVAVACDSLGAAEAMLAATVAYAGVRQQFGRFIGSFQAVKHACADLLVQVSVSRELLDLAVRAVATDSADAPVAASMAKSYVCAAAVDVTGKAMQLHGGYGYTWESGVHIYLKRAALSRSLFGSPAAHRSRLASRYVATTLRTP